MGSTLGESTSSHKPRRNFYGRSATTSVSQLLSESDVLKSCSNFIQKLSPRNFVPSKGNNECSTNGSMGLTSSSTSNYSQSNPVAPSSKPVNNDPVRDSPLNDYRAYGNSRKNSTSSLCSNQSDSSYAFIKYKPPLPTAASHYGNPSNLNSNSNNNNNTPSSQHTTSSTTKEPNSVDYGGTSGSIGLARSRGAGSLKSKYPYFANDRLRELEEKFTERYSRIFGPKKSWESSTTDVNNSSGSREQLNGAATGSKGKNSDEEFHGYGLAKSASACVGAGLGSYRPSYGKSSSNLNNYYYGRGDYGSNNASTSNINGNASVDNNNGNSGRYGGLSSLAPSSRSYLQDYPRTSYGLSKSASSSIVPDSRGIGRGNSGSIVSDRYYPFLGLGADKLSNSNSHLLEPVPEAQWRSRAYRERNINRDTTRELSSGLMRSSTITDLNNRPEEGRDSRQGTVKAEDEEDNESKSVSTAEDFSGSKKTPYKLPSRYYYRRFRHKSSYAPKEASPLSFTEQNGSIHEPSHGGARVDDDNNNNNEKSVPEKDKSVTGEYKIYKRSGQAGNRDISTSHVLAYDSTPRNKTLKDAELLLNSGDDVSLGTSTTTSDSRESRDSPVDEAERIRKKEIEELIKKYSGLTYAPAATASKYLSQKNALCSSSSTSAIGNAVSSTVENNVKEGVKAPEVEKSSSGLIGAHAAHTSAFPMSKTVSSSSVLSSANGSQIPHQHPVVQFPYHGKSQLGYGSGIHESRYYTRSRRGGGGKENHSVIYNGAVSVFSFYLRCELFGLEGQLVN